MSIKNVSVDIILIMVCLWRTERNRSKFRERKIYEEIARINYLFAGVKLYFHDVADARSVTVDNSNMM